MTRFLAALTLVALVSTAGCSRVDLATDLSVTDVITGWHYVGTVDGDGDGAAELNKMVPSVTFELSNASDDPISRVQLLVSFWQAGADGEIDSKQIEGIGATALDPGTSTEPLLVRSDFGYTLAQPKEEMFDNQYFVDFVVKLFARSQGTLVPLGEFPVERRIIPSASTASTPAATAPPAPATAETPAATE